MTTIALRRNDATVKQIINASFPSYKGQRMSAEIDDTVTFSGTMWDEGSRSTYCLIRLTDMARVTITQQAFQDPHSTYHNARHEIPQGVVAVCRNEFRCKESITIIARAENITPMLAAPVELSEDEMTVLVSTRSIKSAYLCILKSRFSEANRVTGITLARWETAKDALMDRKLLNKAGAITIEGRNAVGNKRMS